MTARKPIVLVGGKATELPAGDTLSVNSGQQYAARVPTTQRLLAGAVAGTILGNHSSIAARIIFIPYVPCRRMTITALGLVVSTGVAGTATVGIYAADGNASYDYPGTRLAASAQGAINTGTSGVKTASVSYTLEAGVMYFIAVIFSAAVPVHGVAPAAQSAVLGWLNNSTGVISCYYNPGSTDVLPAVAAAPTVLANTNIPALYMIE